MSLNRFDFSKIPLPMSVSILINQGSYA